MSSDRIELDGNRHSTASDLRWILIAAGLAGIVYAILPRPSLLPMLANTVVTGLAVGVVLDGRNSEYRRKIAEQLPLVWLMLHEVSSLALQVGFPELGMEVGQLTLPGPGIVVRTPVDGFIWFMLAVGLRRLFLRWTNQTGTHPRRGFLALLIWSVVIAFNSRQIVVADYALLFDQHWPEAQRAVGIFDLNTSVWLAAILPLSLLRAASPDRLNTLLVGRSQNGTSILRMSLMFVGAIVVGCGVKFVGFPTLPIIDSLSIRGWIGKASSILLWTAVWEEAVFRVVCVVTIDECIWKDALGSRRQLAIGGTSVLLFVICHLGSNPYSLVFASVVGVVSTVVVLRCKSLNSAIGGHAFCDTVVSTWV